MVPSGRQIAEAGREDVHLVVVGLETGDQVVDGQLLDHPPHQKVGLVPPAHCLCQISIQQGEQTSVERDIVTFVFLLNASAK